MISPTFPNSLHWTFTPQFKGIILRADGDASIFVWSINNLLILVHDLFLNRLVEHIHLSRRKLSRTNAFLEKHVQFSKGPPTRFGQPEVDVDDAEEADSSLVRFMLVRDCDCLKKKKENNE